MAAIPANCFTRRELQMLAVKAANLAGDAVDQNLATLLQGLCRASAAVAGWLADQEHLERLRNVLEPAGYGFEWREQSVTVHTALGAFYYCLSEQYMIAPTGVAYQTGRFRLICGEARYEALSRDELRPLAERYLADFDKVIPEGTRDACLAVFFDPTDGTTQG